MFKVIILLFFILQILNTDTIHSDCSLICLTFTVKFFKNVRVKHSLFFVFPFEDAYYQKSDIVEEDGEVSDAESSSESCLRSSLVIPPIPINTTEEERRLAQAYSEKLDRLGVSVVFKKKNDRREQISEVTRLPACLVEREANMLKKAKQPIATDLAEVSKNSCSCTKPDANNF